MAEITSGDLHDKWVNQTLTKEDIKNWLENPNNHRTAVKLEKKADLDHVVRLMYNIYLWYQNNHNLGHFLTFLVKNDLCGAVMYADSVNVRSIVLYAEFIQWVTPLDFKIKAKGL